MAERLDHVRRRQEFAEAWESCDSISEVAGLTGLSYYGARNRAQRLRELGYPLKHMPRGTRPIHLRENTPEGLGIDPLELSELLEAFRSSQSRRDPGDAGGLERVPAS